MVEKRFDTGEVYLVNRAERQLFNESIIEELNHEFETKYAINRLLSLYVELYDNTLPQSTKPKTCATFFNSIGFTGIAASQRANQKAETFLSESSNSECKKPFYILM